MSLKFASTQASGFIRRLGPAERPALDRLCASIRAAEERLNAAAQGALSGCGGVCGGLCCRNVALEAIVDRTDLVFIFSSDPALEPRIVQRLEKEAPLFTADCLFLEGGVGPCIFPANTRPHVCVTSFCRGEDELSGDIRRVRRSFGKLSRFIQRRRTAHALRRLGAVLAAR
jgi:hypothetical protein